MTSNNVIIKTPDIRNLLNLTPKPNKSKLKNNYLSEYKSENSVSDDDCETPQTF